MEKRGSTLNLHGGKAFWGLLAILLVGFAGNFVLRWSFPGWPAPFVLGLLLVLSGTVLMIWASTEFNRHNTTLKVTEAATTVVKSGPYRYTRNPIYLSMMLAYSGISLVFDSPLALLFVLPIIVLFNQQAKREESYLEGAFGEQYTEYKRRVPRWL